MNAARPCPKCGTLNPGSSVYCYLCQEPFAPGGAPAPSVARLDSGPPGTRPPPTAPRAAPRPGTLLPFDAAASRNARLSLFLFLLLFALFLALGAAIGAAAGSLGTGIAAALVLYAILASTAWFNGASIVLSAHGARKADPEKDRTLLDLVAEMAVASGLPSPKVYVMETGGMNAFAAGRRPGEGVVAVTTGLVERLEREELQGVVAHEMAHIAGRDTLYGICAAVLVGSVALLSDLFLRGTVFRGRGGGGRGRGGVLAFALGILLALAAPLAAKLLQMSISRQREYRADACAVRFTRNPLALAAALGKIAREGADVPGENRGTRHLFFADPLPGAAGEAFSSWLATHPPIERRIERLNAMAGTAVQ